MKRTSTKKRLYNSDISNDSDEPLEDSEEEYVPNTSDEESSKAESYEVSNNIFFNNVA